MDPFELPSAAIGYPVTLHQVRELRLIGRADLAYWRDQLRGEALAPADVEGGAEAVLAVTSARWLGRRFCECSLSVSISRDPAGSTRDGLFLAQAYSDVAAFAWVERNLFGSPYRHARIAFDSAPAWGVEMQGPTGEAVRARMGPAALVGIAPLAEDWRGPLVLPRLPGKSAGQYFRARLAGTARYAPFVHERDGFRIDEGAPDSAWAVLNASGFEPHTWRVCDDALHARTASFAR